MKYLKLFGLVALATGVLAMVIGASTASATVLCKNNLNTEHCSEPYEVGSKGVASLKSGTTAVLETLSGTSLIVCSESTVEAELTNAGSATTTVEDTVKNLSWGGCNHTVDTVNPGRGVLHWITGTDNGTLITFETSVTTFILGVTCSFGAASGGTDMGTTVGGNPGSLMVNTVVTKTAGGSLCPETARFTATYVATSPTNAWVAAG